MNQKDESRKEVSLPEKICDEINAEVKRTGSGVVADFEKVMLKLNGVENLRAKYEGLLAEKKIECEMEKSKIIDVANIENILTTRRNLEREIIELEDLISTIANESLPQINDEIKIVTEKMQDVVFDAVAKVKLKYQAEIDVMFLECNKILSAFHAVFYLLCQDPKFNFLNYIDHDLRTIFINLDTSKMPPESKYISISRSYFQ